MKWHHWPVEVVAKDRSLWDGRHPVAVQAEIPAGKQKTLTTEAELLSYAVNCVKFYFGRCM